MDRYTKEERMRRWRNFGVIPAFVPTGFSILFDIYLEYTFMQIVSRHFLELVLIVFTISVGVFSTAFDRERGLDGKDRDRFIYASLALGVISFAMYSFLYERGTPKSLYILNFFRLGFVVLAIIIIRVGFRLEKEET